MKKEKIEDKIDNYIVKIRKDIPKQYNKVLLLNYLTDPDVRLLMSITTRGDGKTYNYLLALIKIALKFDRFKFMLLSRHFTLRSVYEDTLRDIINENFKLGKRDLFFDVSDQYTIMYINDNPICLITELKKATDLKYSSQILRHYRLIVYDEFIALRGDYLPDEAMMLKTIYESVARPDNSGILEIPKIMLLGNPVNFDSPLFSFFDLYQVLEKQKLGTIEKHGKVVIERFKNSEATKSIDRDIFGGTNDYSYGGEFITNKKLVATPFMITHYKNEIGILLSGDRYLVIHYDVNHNFYLEITYKKPKKIKYTTTLLGLEQNVTYLDEWYYYDGYEQDHNDGLIKYANTYTITQFDNDIMLKQLDYWDLIAEDRPRKVLEPDAIDDEKQLKLEEDQRVIDHLRNEYLFH